MSLSVTHGRSLSSSLLSPSYRFTILPLPSHFYRLFHFFHCFFHVVLHFPCISINDNPLSGMSSLSVLGADSLLARHLISLLFSSQSPLPNLPDHIRLWSREEMEDRLALGKNSLSWDVVSYGNRGGLTRNSCVELFVPIIVHWFHSRQFTWRK